MRLYTYLNLTFLDAHNKDLVEIILAVPLTLLTESDKTKVVQQLALLLHDTRLFLNEIKAQLHTGILLFTLSKFIQ